MFKILGADGKEYGPVTADQLKQWIAEGRANQESMLQREGESGWKPLNQFPEFSDMSGAPASIGTPSTPALAFSGSDPGARAQAEKLVGAPAICLIVTAALGILYAMFGIVGNLLGMGGMNRMGRGGDIPPEIEKFVNLFGGALGVGLSVISILIGLLILYAAIQMKKLRSHGLATTASILAMIPCVSPCCLLGLPFGIWALVVLLKPEVKSQFE